MFASRHAQVPGCGGREHGGVAGRRRGGACGLRTSSRTSSTFSSVSSRPCSAAVAAADAPACRRVSMSPPPSKGELRARVPPAKSGVHGAPLMRLPPRRLTCAGLLCTAVPLRPTGDHGANQGFRPGGHTGICRECCATDGAYDVLTCPLLRCTPTEFMDGELHLPRGLLSLLEMKSLELNLVISYTEQRHVSPWKLAGLKLTGAALVKTAAIRAGASALMRRCCAMSHSPQIGVATQGNGCAQLYSARVPDGRLIPLCRAAE